MPDPQVMMESFSSAVCVTLAEMAGADAMLLETQPQSGPYAPRGVTAILPLSAKADGVLVLSMPEMTAHALAGRILAVAMIEPDAEMIRDCIAEVANVIAGQAKTLLYGTPWHFHFAAPWSEVPSSLTIRNAIRLNFQSDAGELTLLVDFPQ